MEGTYTRTFTRTLTHTRTQSLSFTNTRKEEKFVYYIGVFGLKERERERERGRSERAGGREEQARSVRHLLRHRPSMLPRVQ